MSLDLLTDQLKKWLDDALHVDWLSTLVTIALLALITALCTHVVTVMLRRFLKSNKGPLPAASIFINIARVGMWALGISVILSTCFNINIGAVVTALGVGGIAISLGFQATLSNLIGGLQIIMTGLVEPGDRIQVSSFEGVVHDVTWRHTTIITARGEHVVIPNSVINTEALVKLAPETDVRIDIIIQPEEGKTLSQQISSMEASVNEAIGKTMIVEQAAKIKANGSTERGYRALLSFVVGQGVKRATAIDVAMKAISDCAVKDQHKKAPATDVREPREEHHAKQ